MLNIVAPLVDVDPHDVRLIVGINQRLQAIATSFKTEDRGKALA